VSVSSPAHAILGLSTCEKVKKQILAYEKVEKPLVDSWNMKAGDYPYMWSQKAQIAFSEKWVDLVNIEMKMYTLEMNNLKCFTNTQKIYIKENYAAWKDFKRIIKFYTYPSYGLNVNGEYMYISWDSIYNQ
jgi:phage FluMu gp28-like protein